jgi:hypothetical protein
MRGACVVPRVQAEGSEAYGRKSPWRSSAVRHLGNGQTTFFLAFLPKTDIRRTPIHPYVMPANAPGSSYKSSRIRENRLRQVSLMPARKASNSRR